MDTKKFTVIVTTRLHWNMLHHPEGEDFKPTFDLLISPVIGFGRHLEATSLLIGHSETVRWHSSGLLLAIGSQSYRQVWGITLI